MPYSINANSLPEWARISHERVRAWGAAAESDHLILEQARKAIRASRQLLKETACAVETAKIASVTSRNAEEA